MPGVSIPWHYTVACKALQSGIAPAGSSRNSSLRTSTLITDFDGFSVASTQGQPRRYDTFFPVIFASAHLNPGTLSRPVTPYDVAPTLANYPGVKQPWGSIGNPLVEIVGD